MNNYSKKLADIIVELDDDMLKFMDKNNKAAGVRARAKLQELIKEAQAMRVFVLVKSKNMGGTE